MMFRAQIENRCQLHRVKKKRYQDAHKWVDEWERVFIPPPDSSQEKKTVPKPILKPKKSSQVTSSHGEIANSTNAPKSAPPPIPMPEFGKGVKTKDYTISWRLLSNSGQDEGVIRPIIGAGGFPYYSGASMKGAFLRAARKRCSLEKVGYYCGEKLEDGSYTQGVLRFHGAYPTSIKWSRLVDIIHSQDEKQVIEDATTNANAQISLYKPNLRFGISSREELEPSDWEKIWEIWEFAMAGGIGSRASAGYGHFQEISRKQSLLRIQLKGQGTTSKLVNGKKEFRPNMFKAALRGHTMRLLGGLTDAATAKQITKKLWGGFDGSSAVVGLLGATFNYDDNDIAWEKKKQFYALSKGELDIFCFQENISDDERKKLKETVTNLIQFTLLFSSFGKSWRRACHIKFFESYFEKPEKRPIGSHWEFINNSTNLYLPINQLEDIQVFINDCRNSIKNWIPANKQTEQGVDSWRESWYTPKVQVWARFSEDSQSKAIRWFHEEYNEGKSIKNPHFLAGSMGKTGRIWHRMYPCYIKNLDNEIVAGEGYIELLTIFPYTSDNNYLASESFLNFLLDETDFQQIW